MATADIRAKSLESLPNEILYQIITSCHAQSVFSLYQTSHKLNDLIDNHVWRVLCERDFIYWSPEHDIESRLRRDVKHMDWRYMFINRWSKQLETTGLLDSILESQSGRIDKFQRIVDLGYDVKDCLLEHLSVSDDTEDWLARRCGDYGMRLRFMLMYIDGIVMQYWDVYIDQWLFKSGQKRKNVVTKA